MAVGQLKNILGFSIVNAGRLYVNQCNNYFIELGKDITIEQMGVLVYISVHSDKEIIQQDLAELMNKNKSAILRTIDILEKKGYVKRFPFQNDRRKNIIELTDQGKDITEKALKVFVERDKEITNGINKEDLQTCFRVLNTIQEKCKGGGGCPK